MTCIVGLIEPQHGCVWLGADSAGVAGSFYLTVRRDPKVFRVGQYIIGFTSSFRMGQLLQYGAELPEPPVPIDHGFMCTKFVDAVRKCLVVGGFLKKKEEVETIGSFLVGVAGKLFHVESDLQVGESVHPFNAVGRGSDIALGAMFATPTLPPRERMRMALAAAEQFSVGVRRPFRMISTRKGTNP